MAINTERFEQIPRRDPLEDYLDSAAIIVSRARIDIQLPVGNDHIPEDCIFKAQRVARESMKYLLANRAYATDIRLGTTEERDRLDQLSHSLLK